MNFDTANSAGTRQTILRKPISFVALLLFTILVLASCSNGEDGVGGNDSTLEFPIELTSERIEAGESIYQKDCASCHGPVNGPAPLKAAPVHGDAGHTWHHPDRLLHQWVLDKPPMSTVMPAFRGRLSDEEVMQVLAYIKSHWQPEIRARQTEGSAQYEAQIIEFGAE